MVCCHYVYRGKVVYRKTHIYSGTRFWDTGSLPQNMQIITFFLLRSSQFMWKFPLAKDHLIDYYKGGLSRTVPLCQGYWKASCHYLNNHRKLRVVMMPTLSWLAPPVTAKLASWQLSVFSKWWATSATHFDDTWSQWVKNVLTSLFTLVFKPTLTPPPQLLTHWSMDKMADIFQTTF